MQSSFLESWAGVKFSPDRSHTLMLMNHAELSALLNKAELLTAFISRVQLRAVLEEYLTYPHTFVWRTACVEMSARHVWWEFNTANPHMHLHNCDHRVLIAENMFVFVLWILSWIHIHCWAAQTLRSSLQYSD